MPLYALMIEDGYGHGQVVHYAATSSEDSNHIESIMQSFKECNPTWSMVSVIIIDKDFTEWEILKVEFPNATILFCQFHVIKCLFKKVCDFEIPKDDRDEIRDICDQACENGAYLHIKFGLILELQLIISFDVHKL